LPYPPSRCQRVRPEVAGSDKWPPEHQVLVAQLGRNSSAISASDLKVIARRIIDSAIIETEETVHLIPVTATRLADESPTSVAGDNYPGLGAARSEIWTFSRYATHTGAIGASGDHVGAAGIDGGILSCELRERDPGILGNARACFARFDKMPPAAGHRSGRAVCANEGRAVCLTHSYGSGLEHF